MSNSPADATEAQIENAQTAMAIAITSGKGGVGKTNITSNLGISLAKSGHKVCIFDADTSLANINILLGITPEFTLEQFLSGEKDIEDILLSGPEGLKIVPSASGIAELSDLDSEQQSRVLGGLRTLEQQFDYILIDTAAGISENVIRFLQSAQYAVVVISPEPTSLTDAFSLIKVLHRRNYDKPIYTLVNMAKNYKHSMDVFKRFSHAINKYIHTKVRYLGYIPMDKAMRSAVAAQSPVVVSDPHSPSARCVTLLTQILLKHFKPDEQQGQSVSSFWNSQITENEAQLSSIETLGSKLEPLQNNIGIIQTQKIKEVNRILELTTDALNNQEFNQQQAESLLESTLKNHLEQFGQLPEEILSLLPQTNEQDQQKPDPEPKSEPETESLNTDQPVQNEIPVSPFIGQQIAIETMTATAPAPIPSEEQDTSRFEPISAIKGKIDHLVNEAIRTKRELAELSSYINEQYQVLYSDDESSQGVTAPIKKNNTSTLHTSQDDDRQALKHSLRYASAVDRKA